ncbi:MAG: archaetidylserine decarboxylase [Myxococcota bacterium]|nr:archaetidylserine decarboxylase [Myxococcota bacterium]
MKREYVVDIVERLPQATISRMWGWLAQRRHPKPGVALLKRAFVMFAGIDMSESLDDIRDFDSLQELFIRRLKPGARRVEPDPTALGSPVDGRIGAFGDIDSGTLIQAKGRRYSLSRLLGCDEHDQNFQGGKFLTIYLAPCDYHRVHSPVSGVVSESVLIPGALMPVFPEAVEKVEELFARNERLITYIDSSDVGRVGVVMVGATLVGRMVAAYDESLITNCPGQSTISKKYDPAHLLQKGGELGAFTLGSTVVLIFEEERVSFAEVTVGNSVRMGQRLGTILLRKQRQGKTLG